MYVILNAVIYLEDMNFRKLRSKFCESIYIKN